MRLRRAGLIWLGRVLAVALVLVAPPSWADEEDDAWLDEPPSEAAKTDDSGQEALAPPPDLEAAKRRALEALEDAPPGPESGGVRLRALREEALRYGAEAGLAWRTHQIRASLLRRARRLDRVYDFASLTIVVPGGGLIVPPVIDEARETFAVAEDARSASMARRVWRIRRLARIAQRAPSWRDYLLRDWKAPKPPSRLLLPRTPEERAAWDRWVDEGWARGVEQAERIFQADLARLQADFTGMARYRALVARGVVHELFLAAEDLGVTGGAREVHVGERVVRITAPARFAPSDAWRAIVLTAPEGRSDG